jgi:hypothetical protein
MAKARKQRSDAGKKRVTDKVNFSTLILPDTRKALEELASSERKYIADVTDELLNLGMDAYHEEKTADPTRAIRDVFAQLAATVTPEGVDDWRKDDRAIVALRAGFIFMFETLMDRFIGDITLNKKDRAAAEKKGIKDAKNILWAIDNIGKPAFPRPRGLHYPLDRFANRFANIRQAWGAPRLPAGSELKGYLNDGDEI